MPRIIASIEARMGSSRFPGKVLSNINNKPALTRLIYRLRRCKMLDDIILATTVEEKDDVLEEWAKSEGVKLYRGSEEDVLLRVVKAHQMMQTDIIVEITADCVLLDPEIIDMAIMTFLGNESDVITNTVKRTFANGLDTQVFRLKDLEEVEREISDPAVREHVSLYFYEHPDKYKILHFFALPRWKAPEYRFVLDYPEDNRFINAVYRRLEPKYGDDFGVEEIMALIRNEPTLIDINKHCKDKPIR